MMRDRRALSGLQTQADLRAGLTLHDGLESAAHLPMTPTAPIALNALNALTGAERIVMRRVAFRRRRGALKSEAIVVFGSVRASRAIRTKRWMDSSAAKQCAPTCAISIRGSIERKRS